VGLLEKPAQRPPDELRSVGSGAFGLPVHFLQKALAHEDPYSLHVDESICDDRRCVDGIGRSVLMAVLAAAGCGDSSKADPPIVGERAPCGWLDTPAGTVDVSERSDLFHDGVFSRVEARFLEAPYPSFHGVALEEGSCRYLELDYGDCDPACVGGEVCTAEGVCAAFPAGVAAGRLTVDGLGSPVSIVAEDFDPGLYLGPAGLPAPLFEATDVIGARLSGGDVPRMTLDAAGVAQMDADLVNSGLTLVDGGDVEIAWTAGPDPDACIQMVLNGSNLVHGAPLRDIVWCEGPDSGSLVVPQAMVERFPHGDTPEVSEGYDHPPSILGRYTRSRAETEMGPVELLVRSTTYFLVSHPEL